MDVNGLKTVNDNLGHAAGDELLVGAAKCIQQCFGNSGKVFRIGGDEFIAMIHTGSFELSDILCDFEEAQSKWHGETVQKSTKS